MYLLLAPSPRGAAGTEPAVDILRLDASGAAVATRTLLRTDLPLAVRELERELEGELGQGRRPRWVWYKAQGWYPDLLAAGVRVDRCHDVALCRNILVHSTFTAGTDYALTTAPLPLDDRPEPRPVMADQVSLFEELDQHPRSDGPEMAELRQEFTAQLQSVRESTQPARLTLLLAAESAGALIAAEMRHTGLPWRADLHEQILLRHLGPRPTGAQRPEKLEFLAGRLREELKAPSLNPDSAQELVRALHRAGIETKTTRSWELEQISHPAIELLLAYKKISRLHTANGWAWLDQWVAGGRFRPEYVVGGVVSGRWASRGGGALQIPRQIRAAAHADPGWKLIVADAAQLEPRVLAALAKDSTMAEAARDKDLYAGIAAQGFGGDRAKAKAALLGAMYGATTGESGRLMGQLAKSYPAAVGFVEAAARAGERGEVVTSRLGRSCPAPSDQWLATQRSSTAEEQRRAESAARSRGRFTRNFVVQGSAADWAACWLAEVRRRLGALTAELAVPSAAGTADATPAHRKGPELVFFLHDEVMVHAPDELLDSVVQVLEESSRAATRLLFGNIPIAFPVNITVVDSYADAK
ncbi:bifunctional 3'-5' exonuclease/DNA polymerase [Paeniglutamicibacter antarcticus]|uniref:DNA-directed DNA polymerase n=1 Tax=Arthrobacter terrae TaxID=2935737 RepID=A0A931G3W3_9MICC|nr:bifunctional 3'-5' exonuclease/DNA polymerase [Arthrobacter terrae]MBG0738163.1 bifunctional 3'-5' exonuclease/DNA polymerase [Arthrobacter terrae]